VNAPNPSVNQSVGVSVRPDHLNVSFKPVNTVKPDGYTVSGNPASVMKLRA